MRNISDKNCIRNQNIQVQSWRLLDEVEKYGMAGQATHDKVKRRMRIAF